METRKLDSTISPLHRRFQSHIFYNVFSWFFPHYPLFNFKTSFQSITVVTNMGFIVIINVFPLTFSSFHRIPYFFMMYFPTAIFTSYPANFYHRFYYTTLLISISNLLFLLHSLFFFSQNSTTLIVLAVIVQPAKQNVSGC